MSVTIRDTNHMDELSRTLRELGTNTIKVGISGDDDSEMVMIGAVHEYGTEITVTPKMRAWFAYSGFPLKQETTTITIPERSFLRSTFDERADEITDKIKSLMPSVLEGEVDPNTFMDMIGLEFSGFVQKKIKDLRDPANSEMTAERKNSDNPLIDTGRMVGAIRHKVE